MMKLSSNFISQIALVGVLLVLSTQIITAQNVPFGEVCIPSLDDDLPICQPIDYSTVRNDNSGSSSNAGNTGADGGDIIVFDIVGIASDCNKNGIKDCAINDLLDDSDLDPIADIDYDALDLEMDLTCGDAGWGVIIETDGNGDDYISGQWCEADD